MKLDNLHKTAYITLKAEPMQKLHTTYVSEAPFQIESA